MNFWEPLSAIDHAISQSIQGLRGDRLDVIMIVVTSMADTHVLVVADVLIVALLIATGHRRLALASGFLLLGCAGIVQSIKWLLQRSRPMAELYDGVSAFSFPSGHATNASAMLLVLLCLAHYSLTRPVRKAVMSILLAIALLIGGSRIYLQAHWPSDIVAGYIVALFTAALSSLLLSSHSHRLHPRIFWASLACWISVGSIYTFLRFQDQLPLYWLQLAE